jgi:hypothetical protein
MVPIYLENPALKAGGEIEQVEHQRPRHHGQVEQIEYQRSHPQPEARQESRRPGDDGEVEQIEQQRLTADGLGLGETRLAVRASMRHARPPEGCSTAA